MSEAKRLEITSPETNHFVVRGEIDAHSVAELQSALLAADSAQPVVLDLEAVDFLDSSGLRAIVEQHQQCAAYGTELVLRQPSRVVRRLLEVTALDTMFRIE
jgi:anti-sigma B factor antagonist